MRKGVRAGNGLKLGARLPIEGAAGAGEPDAVDILGSLPYQALKNRAVLGVHGDEATRLCERHQEVSAADDGLLVRVREDLVGTKGLVAGMYSRKANEGVHDDVHVGQRGEVGNRLLAEGKLAAPGKLLEHGLGSAR